MRAATALATLAGYVALSYEILWIRAYSFLGAGAAYLFGVFLGSYLLGLAAGAAAARRHCATGERSRHLPVLALFLGAANVAGFLLVPALAALTPPLDALLKEDFLTVIATQPLAMVAAGLLGTALPLVAHFGIPADERAGVNLSYLYLGNILGSATGSLVTGYVLMDVWPLRTIALFLALLGLALCAGVAWLGRVRPVRAGVALAVTAGAITLMTPRLYDGVYERLLFKEDYRAGERLTHVVENRSGVICVDSKDRIYGGGSYDGAFNTDPVDDRNGIVRAYALAAIHDAPRDVLVIGLSSGSWVQVIAHHPTLERLTVVEINPGYVDLIRRFPEVASLLENPKVEIVIDDGRRWLRRNDDRFDAIVQNTTQHWRGHVTNLLSREYLGLARAHLKPGGVFYYNTTESADVQRTGAAVFPHAWRFRTFLAVSDAPFAPDRARWARVLERWRIDGKPVAPDTRIPELVREPWEDRASILARTEGAEIITDDNLASEWWW